jgi:hypothetical protein
MKAITPQRARYIKGKLRALEEEGAPAVSAIAEFLRAGTDVDFAIVAGGEFVGHRTLRQAMIDTLGRIGGNEAILLSREQIQRTTEPLEVVMLARTLESAEPGLHGAEVIDAIDDALTWAAQAPARSASDVGPLFELLRDYRADRVVPLLERSARAWQQYALIALADLPGGAGIESLTAMAGAADATIANRALPLQLLAQATAEYPQAAGALIDLARAGGIPDEAWDALGEALEGKQLQFSRRMFEGTPLTETNSAPLWRNYYIEWRNVSYEQDVVSADWSDERVAHQLALIDDLRELTSSPTARYALQHARESLSHDRAQSAG